MIKTRYSLSFKRWMRRVKMARFAMYSLALTCKVAKFPASKNRVTKNSIMIICGAPPSACQSAGALACSTAAILKRFWLSKCIKVFYRGFATRPGGDKKIQNQRSKSCGNATETTLACLIPTQNSPRWGTFHTFVTTRSFYSGYTGSEPLRFRRAS